MVMKIRQLFKTLFPGLFVLAFSLQCKESPKIISTPDPVKEKNVSTPENKVNPPVEKLVIVGNNIWVRSKPATGEVIMKLNDGTECVILDVSDEQVIRGMVDVWYKIEHDGKQGWVFGSQTDRKFKATLDSFEPYIKHFLSACFSDKNLDSLIYHEDKYMDSYIHPKIGFTRMYNPGVACVPFGLQVDENTHGNLKPDVNGLPLFQFHEPEDGFCEESKDNDGIYYFESDLPSYPDMSGEMKVVQLAFPEAYQNAPVMEVNILKDKWIISKMSFVLADGKWWLFLIDDCDCSA